MGEAYGVAMAVYIRIFRELDCIGFCPRSLCGGRVRHRVVLRLLFYLYFVIYIFCVGIGYLVSNLIYANLYIHSCAVGIADYWEVTATDSIASLAETVLVDMSA